MSSSSPQSESLHSAVMELPALIGGTVYVGRLIDLASNSYQVSINIDGVDNVYTISTSTVSLTPNDINSALAVVGSENSSAIMIIGKVDAESLHNFDKTQMKPVSNETSLLDETIERSSVSESMREAQDFMPTKIIESDEAILIRCGESSLHMTRDGRITLKGKYVTQASTNTSRITGGSVKIN